MITEECVGTAIDRGRAAAIHARARGNALVRVPWRGRACVAQPVSSAMQNQPSDLAFHLRSGSDT